VTHKALLKPAAVIFLLALLAASTRIAAAQADRLVIKGDG
jgi:hypothetical protein